MKQEMTSISASRLSTGGDSREGSSRDEHHSLDSLLGEGHELVSRTHHEVYRSRDQFLYLKTTRHRDSVSASQLGRERLANDLLGREIHSGVLYDDSHRGHPYLLSPSHGTPVKEWSPILLSKALDYMESLPHLPSSVPGLPEGDEWPALVLRSIQHRGSSVDISHLLDQDYSALLGNRLAHRDPHLGNWVMDEDGNFTLIDWEAALRSSLDVMRATILYNVILLGDGDAQKKLLKPLLRGVESSDGVRAALELKGASAASWAEWAGLGKGAMALRRDTAMKAMKLL